MAERSSPQSCTISDELVRTCIGGIVYLRLPNDELGYWWHCGGAYDGA